jgi:hypothetical protein
MKVISMPAHGKPISTIEFKPEVAERVGEYPTAAFSLEIKGLRQ